jgi:DNA-binding NarL/FixJ family response regulator
VLVDQALQAGARGYISKNSSPEVLVTAVRKIAEGQKYVDPELAQNVVVGESGAVVGIEALSPREFEVLCLYAEARSLDEIASELSLSSKTVANYLTSIKEKLEVESTTELVRFAISKGLASL